MSQRALPATAVAAVSLQQRATLLAQVPAFAHLDASALDFLAASFAEERFVAGQVILAEGDIGTDLYLLASGQAAATTEGAKGQVVLAQMRPGEIFGELALLDAEQRRQASVTAESDSLVLRLGADAFQRVLTRYPAMRDQLAEAREHLLVARFLKASSPFATVDNALVREMAKHLRRLSVPPGTAIVRQGEVGETCYLVRSGRVQVSVRDGTGDASDDASDDASSDGGEATSAGEHEREVATLLPGMLFGEAALLTAGRRNATVRALDDCELIEVRRSDLMQVLGMNAEVRAQVVDLMRLRDRPRAVADILVHQRASATGEALITLQNPHAKTYYRLSPQGYFIWQRLDGKHNLRDLSLDYMVAFKTFSPQVIAELIAGLRTAGFVESDARIVADLPTGQRLPAWRRTLNEIRGVLEWQVTLPGVDNALGWLYAHGLRLLYTRVGQATLALLSLLGVLAFTVLTVRDGERFAQVRFGGWLLLGFGVAYLLSTVIHEFGHGLTCKAFGHEVVAGGVGWFWLGPSAFVDTSDLWTADRWPRIATSLAGPYANLLLGSVAALVALGHGYGLAQAALWQFALTSYTLAIINLNPLFEYDGYFVLLDLLGTGNLKERSLRWLGTALASPRLLRQPDVLRAHRVDLLYGAGAIGYTVLMTVLVVASYRLVLQGWVALVIPAGVAEVLAWVLAVAVIVMAFTDIVGGMRGEQAAGAG